MAARTRAGIELIGSVLRYAAIEEQGDSLRLLRLGRCDFDFDVAGLLQDKKVDDGREALAGALDDVFSGIDVTHFHVVLHPGACTLFFSPVTGGVGPLERNEQLHWEAGQLMDVPEDAFKIVVHPVRSEEHPDLGPVDWYHVTAVPRYIYGNFVSLLRDARLEAVTHFAGSVQAASSMASHLAKTEEDEPGVALVFGQYGEHYECSICRGQTWTTSSFLQGQERGDVAYLVTQMLQQLDLEVTDVDRLWLYGPAVNEAALEAVQQLVGRPVERLNPFQAVGMEAGARKDDFSYWEYVSSIGATL